RDMGRGAERRYGIGQVRSWIGGPENEPSRRVGEPRRRIGMPRGGEASRRGGVGGQEGIERGAGLDLGRELCGRGRTYRDLVPGGRLEVHGEGFGDRPEVGGDSDERGFGPRRGGGQGGEAER